MVSWVLTNKKGDLKEKKRLQAGQEDLEWNTLAGTDRVGDLPTCSFIINLYCFFFNYSSFLSFFIFFSFKILHFLLLFGRNSIKNSIFWGLQWLDFCPFLDAYTSHCTIGQFFLDGKYYWDLSFFFLVLGFCLFFLTWSMWIWIS